MGKIKEFYEEHKFGCRLVGAIVIGGVSVFVGYKGVKAIRAVLRKDKEDTQKLLDAMNTIENVERIIPSGRQAQLIDEDIFTRVAPLIEDFVLTDGIDESFFETTYNVSFPKNGDGKEMYDVMKKIRINMYEVYD